MFDSLFSVKFSVIWPIQVKSGRLEPQGPGKTALIVRNLAYFFFSSLLIGRQIWKPPSWSWREVENVSETKYRKEVYSMSERVGKRSPEAAIGAVIKSYLGHLTQARDALVFVR